MSGTGGPVVSSRYLRCLLAFLVTSFLGLFSDEEVAASECGGSDGDDGCGSAFVDGDEASEYEAFFFVDDEFFAFVLSKDEGDSAVVEDFGEFDVDHGEASVFGFDAEH